MKKQKITFDYILDSIVDRNSISKTFARTLLKELTDLIREGLEKDSTVTLAGFGIFKLHSVPQRSGRSIKDGQPITIPAHRKVLFKPEKHIRELINKKYEDLKAEIPAVILSKTENKTEENAAQKPQPQTETTQPPVTKKDPTESEITLSAIAKSLDSMIKDEPKKKSQDELTDAPVLKDDIMGVEEKEKSFKFEEEEKSNKKIYIGATLIAILLIILLFSQFAGDDANEVEIAANEKTPAEIVVKKEQAAAQPVVKNAQEEAIKTKTVTSVRGDNLWHLAFKHYNDGYLWPLILQANKAQISNPDLIEPGVEIKIPVIVNTKKLTEKENKMLSEGHLTAYFAYKNTKEKDARNHLFVADRYDHENVKNSLTKIDNSDYESIKSLSMN